ncbi:MAG: 50S ribosomal protein L1 [Patescibacteria group bacterium]|jgi:large subunit ribosomal protein L1
MKRSKRYQTVNQMVDTTKAYPIDEALELVAQTAQTKFDSSVDVHIHLGIDTKKANQQVRSTAQLPNPTGRKNVIAVIASEADQAKAKAAGADIVGGDDLIQKIKTTQKIDFDIAIATPEMMRSLGQIAKLLGTKGVMPNPKNETVTADVVKTVRELKSGKVAFRADETGNIHQMIGKVSHGAAKLKANYIALLEAVRRAKPDTAKGEYIANITLASTMGPGIRVSL